MERRWRSEAWRAANRRTPLQAAKDCALSVALATRAALSRIFAGPPLSYLSLAASFRAAHEIRGDYAEFGVYTGRQFVQAFKCISRAESSAHDLPPARYFAFDSFLGLPTVRGIDAVFGSFGPGSLSATEEEFRLNLARHRVPRDRVVVVSGWFSEVLCASTASRFGLDTVAIALIDCDLYESAVPVLAFLTPLLANGAVIVFDDWYLFRAHPQLGVQRAFAEWRERNEGRVLVSEFQHISGSVQKAFLVHRPLPNAETP